MSRFFDKKLGKLQHRVRTAFAGDWPIVSYRHWIANAHTSIKRMDKYRLPIRITCLLLCSDATRTTTICKSASAPARWLAMLPHCQNFETISRLDDFTLEMLLCIAFCASDSLQACNTRSPISPSAVCSSRKGLQLSHHYCWGISPQTLQHDQQVMPC